MFLNVIKDPKLEGLGHQGQEKRQQRAFMSSNQPTPSLHLILSLQKLGVFSQRLLPLSTAYADHMHWNRSYSCHDDSTLSSHVHANYPKISNKCVDIFSL